jgi:ribonuclease D
MNKQALPVPDNDAIALLPAYPRLGLDGITRVANAEQAAQAWSTLRQHTVWGFDTESRPTFHKDQVSDGPHVLQLATANHAWVIQLHDPAVRQTVAAWLADPAYLKAGFGLGDDTKRLLRKLGVAPQGVLELNAVFRALGYRREMGVKGAVAVLFGQRFAKSKKAATSNWSVANLSESQVLYAANDAWAAGNVYAALYAAHPALVERLSAPVSPPNEQTASTHQP